MIQNRWILVLALGLLAATSAVAQEAEPPTEAKPTEAKPTEAKPADEIVVEILGLENDQGQIGCRIFSKEDGFPDKKEKADKQLYSKPKSKKGGCTFVGYKPGTYAISVMHDLDKSGDLNTSLVGRPKEPWGVSNDVPARRFGPPLYQDCTFKYEGGKKIIKIKLQM
jgi:uncharacterized protein (DUF2141 family)